MSVKKTNWHMHLEEVHRQFIAIKDEDYNKSHNIFRGVFQQVKKIMEKQCTYFMKYSNQVLYAGSVYDRIKVSKLDEFDMDVVIHLPINYDKDISLETDKDHPGFVKLKIGQAFDLLVKQNDWEACHKVTLDWRDTDKYLLQNKFRQWMHGIVQKALNDMNGQVAVNGVTYLVKYKESGPAYTLNIENDKGNEEFTLDVDLVPVIKFQYPRWPKGCRTVANSSVQDWLVVPKPDKAILDSKVRNRFWRLSFQDFERDMMKGCYQLKPTIRLVKKLRDSLEMEEIASYYIKTIFLRKIAETNEKKYWQKGLGDLFHIMVKEFYTAVKNKKIVYFWHEQNNLIGHLKEEVLVIYADKLKKVIDGIESNDVIRVVSYLLNTDEKKSKFYNNLQGKVKSSLKAPLSCQQKQTACLSASTSPKDKRQKLKTGSGGKASTSKENATDFLQPLKPKIDEYIEICTQTDNPMDTLCEDSTSSLEEDMKSRVLKDKLEYLLKSLHENVDNLENKKGNTDLCNKIDVLLGKTNKLSYLIKKLKATDTEYMQKISKLLGIVIQLIDENEALKRDIDAAETKGYFDNAISFVTGITAPLLEGLRQSNSFPLQFPIGHSRWSDAEPDDDNSQETASAVSSTSVDTHEGSIDPFVVFHSHPGV